MKITALVTVGETGRAYRVGHQLQPWYGPGEVTVTSITQYGESEREGLWYEIAFSDGTFRRVSPNGVEFYDCEREEGK